MGDIDKTLLALDEGFSNNRESAQNNNLQQEVKKIYNDFLQYNNQLCEELGITKIPFILVNGHRLPAGCSLMDIEYYIEYIKDNIAALENPMQRKEVIMI